MAYGEREVYWTGPVRPRVTAVEGGLKVQFESCTTDGIELRGATGFEVQIDGKHWVAATAVQNAQMQFQCAVTVAAPADLTGSLTQLRYNWFRSVCYANETKDGFGTGRCAVYSGGLPAPPFVALVG